jgi:hypothetical protein
MILPEDRPESPSKLRQPTAEQPQSAQGQEPLPPPAYDAASGSRPVQADPEAQTVYVPLVIRRGEPAGKRFCQAFCVAVIIYFLLGALLGSIVEVGHGRRWPREVCLSFIRPVEYAVDGITSRENGKTLRDHFLRMAEFYIA